MPESFHARPSTGSSQRGAWPPALSAPERAHSERLTALIREEIDRLGGGIPFSRFMELALYAPGLGYYSAGAPKFGNAAEADFITAPELSPLYAGCLARQCAEILERLGGGDVLEVGAGSGALAVGILRALDARACLPERYLILELSAELQQRQALAIERELPQLFPRVRWLHALPGTLRGVVVANELLDAMPVQRFRAAAHEVEELHVGWTASGFAWDRRPADEVLARLGQALRLPSGYVSEINLHAEAWVRSIAERLREGVLLLIDYGFPRAEYYHPQRTRGTLMCHYRRRAHDDPLILVGLQDITAHIDFTAIAEAGTQADLELLGYTSQAAFLLATGLTELVGEPDLDKQPEQAELARQIDLLTSPAEMGELYKVMALGRGIERPLLGFRLQDRRGRL